MYIEIKLLFFQTTSAGTIAALTFDRDANGTQTQTLSPHNEFCEDPEHTYHMAASSFMVRVDDEQVPNDQDSRNQDTQPRAPSHYEFPKSPEQMYDAASPFVNNAEVQVENETNEKAVSNKYESSFCQPEDSESRNSTSNTTSGGNMYQELDVAAIMTNSYTAVTAVKPAGMSPNEANEQNEFKDGHDNLSDDGIYWNDDALSLPNDESTYATVGDN